MKRCFFCRRGKEGCANPFEAEREAERGTEVEVGEEIRELEKGGLTLLSEEGSRDAFGVKEVE